jgi:hypothetical protein
MNDEKIKALAVEALAIARRMHADWHRLGEILSDCSSVFVEGDEPDKEKLRRQDLFDRIYFQWDALETEGDAELAGEQDWALWGWEIQWAGGFDTSCLPPLPVADEIQYDLADELG